MRLRAEERKRIALKKAQDWADRQGKKKEVQVRQKYQKHLNNLTSLALRRIRKLAHKKAIKDEKNRINRRRNQSKRQIAETAARKMKIALQKAKLAGMGLTSHKKLLSKLAHAKLVRNLKNKARLGLK